MDKKFIDGIYSYCDRWCERCSLTNRCRVYERSSKLMPEPLDINCQAFWQMISSNFQRAGELLHQAFVEEGIDLNAISADKIREVEEQQQVVEAAAAAHPISTQSKKYTDRATAFLENEAGPGLTNRAKELTDQLQMGLKGETDTVYTMISLKDCEEIIDWYVFFIEAKLQRAIRGKLEGEEWQVENGFQKDSDGSAKIAIIAIERSMAAWKKMYELMPSCEDSALLLLSLLTQLKQQVLVEFPEAMWFRRPGFDDAELN